MTGKERLTELTDEGANGNYQEFTTFSEQASAFTLKNGKIFLAGIVNPGNDYVQTKINLRIYDPLTKAELSGITLDAHSKYISCYEQKDNEVYCVYVYKEDPLKSLLGIQYFKVTDVGIVQKGEPFLIKAFYTQFNYVKAMKYDNNEVGIFFQTGNQKYEDIPYGNAGKDLYYYQLDVNPESIQVIRYDYISANCRFSKDAEDYTSDMIIFEGSVYVICELDNEGNSYAKAFKGFVITKDVKKVSYIEFNRYEGKGVKNPQFVRFDKSLALLYTHILKDDTKNVNLMLMNYPDCSEVDGDIYFYGICPANNQKKELSKKIKVFLDNPYPSSMQNTKVYFRFINFNNMVVLNGNIPLELNKDYDLTTINDLSIKEFPEEEHSYLEYVATRKDSIFGDILGKTCRIQVENPTCLPQCNGCDKKGNAQDNRCFECKHGYWSEPKAKDETGCGNNTNIYNCHLCDIACERCDGPFLNTDPPTTNCIRNYCNYNGGYYPYEDDYRTCFNKSDKANWEQLLHLDRVLYLDQSKSNNPRDWVWRKCHKNCAACNATGDDIDNKCDVCKNDLFFYCNQTRENKGIPGTCHESCEGNGCYKTEKDGMTKMCPCFENCKNCTGPDLCDVCRNTWLLQPERTSCNKSCGYCLTPHYDDEKEQKNGRCINCKDEFHQYTFDNKCLSKLPYFNYTEYGKDNTTYTVQKFYHVIDAKCDLITGCKRGCFKCSALETDLCTECDEKFYKYHPKKNKTYFKCFTKRECQGLDPYAHAKDEYEGGVALEEEETEEKVCLNCKLTNNS